MCGLLAVSGRTNFQGPFLGNILTIVARMIEGPIHHLLILLLLKGLITIFNARNS